MENLRKPLERLRALHGMPSTCGQSSLSLVGEAADTFAELEAAVDGRWLKTQSGNCYMSEEKRSFLK